LDLIEKIGIKYTRWWPWHSTAQYFDRSSSLMLAEANKAVLTANLNTKGSLFDMILMITG